MDTIHSIRDRPKPPPRKKSNYHLAPISENKVLPSVSPSLSARHKLPPPPVPEATIREGVEEHFAMPRLTNLPETDIMDRIKGNCNKLTFKSQYQILVRMGINMAFDKMTRSDIFV